jgi:hypothetical protein
VHGEQRRNLISGEGRFRLSAGRFAGFRYVYRSDFGRWAVRLGQDHSVAIALSSTYRSSRPIPSQRQRDYPPTPRRPPHSRQLFVK